MNQRERVLLIVVIALGVVAVLFVGQMAYATVADWLQTGKTRIANLQKQLDEKKRQVRETDVARRKIADWKARSLPGDPASASNLYRAWLLERFEAARFQGTNVASAQAKPERGLYTALTFTVTGTGNLQQIVELLHDFYSVDHLHRITRLKIGPTKEPKQLLLTITVEALSMLGAEDADELAERPGQRLAISAREDYLTAILERNLFGAPNRVPKLSGVGNISGTVGTPVEVALKADDDSIDKHTFRLEKSDARDAYLDRESGTFRWTPRRTGTYEFVVSVTDDGVPARTTTEKLVVAVEEASAPPPPSRPSFDEAKYTVLAAVIDKSGQSEIWLHVRPRDKDALLRLGVGDDFEVGSVKGTVKSIAISSFVFESDGKLLTVESGQPLTAAIATQ